MMRTEPKITVGIMDRQAEVTGRLDGDFCETGSGPVSGWFSSRSEAGMIVLTDHAHHEVCRSPSIRLTAREASPSQPVFTLFHVTVGNRFHWQKTEDQTFQGDLILRPREDRTIVAINEIFLEDYLKSVISSEMSDAAPFEFLKAHAILSRSWLLASLDRRKEMKRKPVPDTKKAGEDDEEVIRWYDREDHDLFDVCADDHCQRYHGITKIGSGRALNRSGTGPAQEAVHVTHGKVMTYRDEVCDARYSKACGGITEAFDTAWEEKRVPYLESISDAVSPHRPVGTEEEALRWVLSEPEAYCNTKDGDLLEKILPGLDRETESFFRWEMEYSREQLEGILREKSGLDFGTLKEMVPLRRGPSGRISRLKIVGSKKSLVVGKELEIRRWLSPTHLYSSAFVVTAKHRPDGEVERFILHGAGWGHGVGLCQIGAAVMAARGHSAEEILSHYFRGTEIRKVYSSSK